jgi:phospholipase/carboxylesterase
MPHMRLLALLPLLLLTPACHVPGPAGAEAPAPVTAAAAAQPPLAFVERVVGGARPDDPLPLVIVVHGLGDRPENIVRLFEPLPLRARLVAPRAPAAHGRGFSWFPVAKLPPAPSEPAREAGIRESAAKLAELARWLAANRPTRGRPVLTGFSQGGILSFAVAALHPEAIAAAVPVAGALPAPLRPGRAAPVPIRAFHGDADTVIPHAAGEETVKALRAAGADATLRTYGGVGHTIPPKMRADLYETLAGLLN